MKCLIVVGTIGCSWFVARTSAADACFDAAKAQEQRLDKAFATAAYWTRGAEAVYLRGSAKTLTTGKLIFYLPKGSEAVTRTELGVPVDMREDQDKPDLATLTLPAKDKCAGLFALRYEAGPPVQAPPPPTTTRTVCADVDNALAGGPDDVIAAHRRLPGACSRVVANSAASGIASEAIQILGQIVVDRASQAAYAMLSTKLQKWMKCTTAVNFVDTCRVVKDLRLQDLAMAPDLLRGALTTDALRYIGVARKKLAAPVASSVVRTHATFAAADGTDSGQEIDPIELMISVVVERVVPALNRPAEAITGRSAEVVLRQLVDRGLRAVAKQGAAGFCGLTGQNRVLATAAVAFAACELKGGDECPIMQYVAKFDSHCTAGKLTMDQLAYAESIAGHLLDAMVLKKDSLAADGRARLNAATEAVFEVACMYAHDEGATRYACDVESDKHGDRLEAREQVAIARDVTRAALDRNGAALVAVVVKAVVRVVPKPEDATETRGLRVLATLAAYAATYTAGGADDDAAHEKRTSLLESLTRDMSDRTDRGGDTIVSLGGSLRAVGGRRIGHTTATVADRPEAFWGPLSLPLGFGVHYLKEKTNSGFHMEISILDLGQYLSWDEGGKLAEPSLVDAFSPSITVGWFCGREVPFFFGLTGGYTPGFDFDADDATDREGAFNGGLTVGAYVPLFDLN